MTNPEKNILTLLGPTACGKTGLSLDLAQALDCQIVSADSMQVYRGMDIGSAKLPPEQRRGIPHYLLDVADPTHGFSVAEFRKQAGDAIEAIFAKGRLPLLCGGTGLYLDSLIRPSNYTPEGDSDPELRQKLQQEFAADQGETLYRELLQADPACAARIHAHDSRRLIRAIEVYRLTGHPISEFQQQNQPPLFASVTLGLTAPRELLYRRIEERVDEMMAQGLEQEVAALLEQGVSRDAVSMQGLGYRQLAMYLAGECSREEAVALIKRDTRRFAKRQLTWFRRYPDIHWFSIDQYPQEGDLTEAVLSLIRQKGGNP